MAMNLHPTNARRVFPCMDEPNLATTIAFTFENMEYSNLILNSMLATDSQYVKSIILFNIYLFFS